MKANLYILVLCSLCLLACTGSRKYLKAAEKLEKQGLVNEAADYYLESLQRKPSNTDAKIKLQQVGQKHVSNLASEFFRSYNTQQLEASLDAFEKLKDFTGKAMALGVQLDYPKTYDDDYQNAVESFCLKNYNQALVLVNQKKYQDAMTYITRVDKYNSNYKNTRQLELVSYCEPLYQSAINNLENKNYSGALTLLSSIKVKTESYKDSRDLLDLATAQQTKSFILFPPKDATDKTENDIQHYLFDNFGQTAMQKLSTVRIINNTPFQSSSGSVDLNSSNNVDLIQAIRKATAADYFYVFDVSNLTQFNPGVRKTPSQGFQLVQTKVSEANIVTGYEPFEYNVVTGQRSFSYDFKYKLINAYSNQIVASQTQTVKGQDNIQYQEFQRKFTGDINSLYPYNPSQVLLNLQYNPNTWRALFSARTSLKTFDELKNDAYNQNMNLFVNSANSMK